VSLLRLHPLSHRAYSRDLQFQKASWVALLPCQRLLLKMPSAQQ